MIKLKRPFNYLRDGQSLKELLHRRWIACGVPDSRYIAEEVEGKGVILPRDENQHLKEEDPDWRHNWQWIVLRVETNTPVRVYCYRNRCSRTGLRTLIRVPTKCFAMRVGPEHMNVFAEDKHGEVVSISRVETGLPLKESLASETKLRNLFSSDELTFI